MSLPEDEGVKEVSGNTIRGSSTLDTDILATDKLLTVIVDVHEVPISTKPGSLTVHCETLASERPVTAIEGEQEVTINTTSESSIVDIDTLSIEKHFTAIKDVQDVSQRTTSGSTIMDSNTLATDKSVVEIKDVQALSASTIPGPSTMDSDILVNGKAMTAIKDLDASPGLSAVGPNIFTTEESLRVSQDVQEVSHNTMPGPSSANLDMHTSGGSTITTGGILLSVRKKVSKMWISLKDERKKTKIQKQVPPPPPHQKRDHEAGSFDSNVQPITQTRGILLSARKKVSKMWISIKDKTKKKQLQTQAGRCGSYVQPITQDNEEILYDRTIGHSIKYEQLLQHIKNNFDCHAPELPFLWSTGHTDYSMINTGRPYVERMLNTVGECNVPRDLHDIIKQGDFVNNNSGSDLSRMLNDLGTECDVMATNDAQFIQQLVCDGIKKLLTKLRSTNVEIFQHVTAVMLGSGAEKTKIDKPDEWDFVIFLPYIWKRNKEKFYPNEPYKVSDLDHRKVISMLKKLNNTVSDRRTIVKALQIILIDFLPSCMEGLEFEDACGEGHKKALPVRLTYESLEIKLDISFGSYDENEPTTKLLIPIEELPQRGFYILHDDDSIHTTTFIEVTYMRNLPNDVRHCYRLTKCLIDMFIPTHTMLGCKCKQSLFTSYRLKNILFYMCEYYDEEIYWSRCQWSNRVIEMFITYAMCLRYGLVNNVFSCSAPSPLDVKPIRPFTSFNKSHLTESLDRLPSKITDCPTYEMYRGVFNKDTDEKISISDIISAFCVILYNLKDPTFTVGNYMGCIPSSHTEIHGKNEVEFEDGKKDKKRCGSDIYGKGLQLIQCIEMEGHIKCLLMSPDHGGEVLIGLTITQTNPINQLIKYQYNEVIQRIKLPGIPMDMCYYNGTVTVIVCWTKDQVLTFNYTDFSLLSSFTIPYNRGVPSITRLKDGCVVVAHASESGIRKMTINGEIVRRSNNIFRKPSGLLAVTNSVVVYDEGLQCIISLSTDLQSTLFKYPSYFETAYDGRPFCKNDRNGSIFAVSMESNKYTLLQISDVGKTIRKFNFGELGAHPPMIYDMFRNSITVFVSSSHIIHRFKLSE